MGKAKVRFLASLATAIGSQEVETEASSLKTALTVLYSKYGNEFKTKIIDTSGNLRRQIKIYVNGKDIRFLNRLDTVLKDGDEVLLLPAVTGG